MASARQRIDSELESRAAWFALISLFPGLAKVAYRPAYLGPRGVAVYVAAKTLFLFALPRWVGPRLQRWAASVLEERAALAAALGREPTTDEFVEHRTQARRRVSRGPFAGPMRL